jgi:hypothetical protein
VPGGAQKNHETSPSGQSMPHPRFKPVISEIHVRNTTALRNQEIENKKLWGETEFKDE